MFIIAHLLGCFFFWIATVNESETAAAWYKNVNSGMDTTGELYTASFYWAMSTVRGVAFRRAFPRLSDFLARSLAILGSSGADELSVLTKMPASSVFCTPGCIPAADFVCDNGLRTLILCRWQRLATAMWFQ